MLRFLLTFSFLTFSLYSFSPLALISQTPDKPLMADSEINRAGGGVWPSPQTRFRSTGKI